MRCAKALLFVAVLVLLAGMARTTLYCVQMKRCSPEEAAQRQMLKRMCLGALAKLQARYGERPLAEWSSEESKRLYAVIERDLAELEEDKP